MSIPDQSAHSKAQLAIPQNKVEENDEDIEELAKDEAHEVFIVTIVNFLFYDAHFFSELQGTEGPSK